MSIRVIQGGTPTPFPGGGGGGHQLPLAAGHFENFVPWPATAYDLQTAAETEPFCIFPRPDSESNVNARQRWAHREIDYEIPIDLRGGGFDYWGIIDEVATSSALIPYISLFQDWRNDTGERQCYVTVTKAGIQTLAQDGVTEYPIQLRFIDQAGRELRVWWSFKVEVNEYPAADSHFIFVNRSYVGGGETGAFATPFTDLVDGDVGAVNVLTGTGANSNGKIVVVQEGGSQTTPYTKAHDWPFLTTGFPQAFIFDPADASRPVIDLEGLRPAYKLNGTDFDSDNLVYGIEWRNGQNPPSTEGHGAFVTSFQADHQRVNGIWNKFDGVSAWPAVKTGNNACITLGWAGSNRKHISFSCIQLANIVASGHTDNTGNALMYMGAQYASFSNWHLSNFATGTAAAPELFSIKHNFSDFTFRQWNVIDNCRFSRNIMNDQQDQLYNGVDFEVCYLNLYSLLTTDVSGFSFLEAAGTDTGPGFCFRCTFRTVSDRCYQVSNWDGIHTFKGNVSNNINVANSPTVQVVQPNYSNLVTGDFNIDGTLTDTWLTTSGETRGTLGHEIV